MGTRNGAGQDWFCNMRSQIYKENSSIQLMKLFMKEANDEKINRPKRVLICSKIGNQSDLVVLNIIPGSSLESSILHEERENL